MKKIAIITMHQVKNYGSVLQTLATQSYFENLGYKVQFIDFRRKWESKYGYWFAVQEKNIKGFLRELMYLPSKIKQFFVFNKFLEEHINLTDKTYVSNKDFLRYPIEADVYCTGSDQVWNSGWNQGIIPEYFLNFVNKANECLKISFAASFGNSEISSKEASAIKPLLLDYDLITVREKPSVEMLKNKFDIESTEILDPTLQMNKEFWMNLCEKDRIIKNKYVLLIQLNRNHDFDDIAVSFAKKSGIKLIRLCLRVDQVVLPGKSIVIPKVEDYVSLIRDAEYVLTDSFHAVSFCLNLEKQFFVYYPKKYFERLKSILNIMSLTNRVIDQNSDFNSFEKIDFEKVIECLNNKRIETKNIIMEKLYDDCN